MQFSSEQSKPREERSNEGAMALAQSILVNILGITKASAQEFIQSLEGTGEGALMRQNLKLLSVSAHTRLNQILDVYETKGVPEVDDELEDEQVDDMLQRASDSYDSVEPDMDEYDPLDGPDDPDNVNIMDYSDMRPEDNDDWTPEEDREEEMARRSRLPGAADPEDYKAESKSHSFLSYLNEMSRESRIDSEIAQMADEEDSELDPAAKRRIDQAEARGDTKRAARLRDQAKRRAGIANKQPERPTQKRVDQKKKELADAIKRDRQAAQGEQQ